MPVPTPLRRWLLAAVAVFAALATPQGAMAGEGEIVPMAWKVMVLEAMCHAGDGKTCYDVGYSYQNGIESESYYLKPILVLRVPRNYQKAVEFYSKGCDFGYANACFFAGMIFEEGRGKKRTEDRNIRDLIEKACDAGDVQNCLENPNQGFMPDSAKARSHYERACELGHASSCFSLGVSYSVGSGAPKDPDKALIFLKRAAELDPKFQPVLDSHIKRNGVQSPTP